MLLARQDTRHLDRMAVFQYGIKRLGYCFRVAHSQDGGTFPNDIYHGEKHAVVTPMANAFHRVEYLPFPRKRLRAVRRLERADPEIEALYPELFEVGEHN